MKRDVALWAGVLTGPVVWSLAFLAKFFMAYWICTFHWKPAAYAISLLALALTAGTGMLAWSQWQQLGPIAPEGEGGAMPRSRAMAMGGVLLSGLFFIVLLAEMLPEVMLAGCE